MSFGHGLHIGMVFIRRIDRVRAAIILHKLGGESLDRMPGALLRAGCLIAVVTNNYPRTIKRTMGWRV